MVKVKIRDNSSFVKSTVKNQSYTRDGHSPYINDETGTWFEYDDKLKKYIDTEVIASISTIDDELSIESKNPVQNKVIAKTLNDITYATSESIQELFNG